MNSARYRNECVLEIGREVWLEMQLLTGRVEEQARETAIKKVARITSATEVLSTFTIISSCF